MDVSFSRFFYFFTGLDRIKESVKPWSRRIRKFPLNIYGEICGGRSWMSSAARVTTPHSSMGGFSPPQTPTPSAFSKEKKEYISSFFEYDTSFEARKKKVTEADKWKRFPQNIEWIIHWISSTSREAKHRTEIPFLSLSAIGKGIFPNARTPNRNKKGKNFLISSARVTTYPKLQKTSISKESRATENVFRRILQESFGNSDHSSSKSKWKQRSFSFS